MHPSVRSNPRLKALWELDETIRVELLGRHPGDRYKLLALRERVRDEIRAINEES